MKRHPTVPVIFGTTGGVLSCLEGRQRLSRTAMRKKISSPESKMSVLVPKKPGQPGMDDGYSLSLRFEHRRVALVSEHHNQLRPRCVRAGKETRERLDTTCSAAALWQCLPRTRNYRKEATPNIRKKYVPDKAGCFGVACFSAKKS